MNPVSREAKYIQKYHNEKGWAKLRNNPLEVKQTVFISKLKTFRMTEILSENKTDEGDAGKEPPKMIRSYQYLSRIITLWDDGRASISGIIFPDEYTAQKQVEFLHDIQVIDARKKE